MIQLSGINFWKLAVLFFNCVLLKELRESWCSIKQTWSSALEQKMTINIAKTWADPGGGGREWMASHPPLEQLTKKINQNIMRGKTYEMIRGSQRNRENYR